MVYLPAFLASEARFVHSVGKGLHGHITFRVVLKNLYDEVRLLENVGENQRFGRKEPSQIPRSK